MAPPDTPAPLGLKEAARTAGVSLSTLRRRRSDLISHGATQHSDGSWEIPVATLIGLGFLDKVGPAKADTPAEPGASADETLAVTPRDTRSIPAGTRFASSDTPVVAPPDALAQARIAALDAEVAQLRLQVAEQKARADIAEAIATERAGALEAERNVLRLLGSGQFVPSGYAPAVQAPAPSTPVEQPRRTWWGGRTRS